MKPTDKMDLSRHITRVFVILLLLSLGLSAPTSAGKSQDIAVRSTPPALSPDDFPTTDQPLTEPAKGDQPLAPPITAAACPPDHCVFLSNVYKDYSPSIDLRDRAASASYYQQVYLASENVPAGWTGNVKSCIAGETSQAFRDAVLLRINYFRNMAGIPKLTGLDDLYNQIDQQAALMISANGQLSHNPATTWKCYTEDGKNGAGSSNLFLGVYGPSAISGYIRDPGSGNSAAGHRRWILYPQTRQMGTGDIPGGSSYNSANALRAWDDLYASPRPSVRDTFVAWPPPGYVPYQVVFPRWSFAYPDADFTSTTVSMKHNGASFGVTKFTPIYGYGENTLVWIINGMSDWTIWPKPASDDPYTVTIKNVVIDGQAKDFEYTVWVINSN